jgi:hypothetical protein
MSNHPFKVGDYVWYLGNVIKQKEYNEIIHVVEGRDYKDLAIHPTLTFREGNLTKSYPLDNDKLVKLEDLYLVIPHLSRFNEEAKEFLRNLTIWCLYK